MIGSCRPGLRCFYHSPLQRDSRRVNLRPLASVGGRLRASARPRSLNTAAVVLFYTALLLGLLSLVVAKFK